MTELEKRLATKKADKDKAVTDAREKAVASKKDAKGIEEAEKAAAKNFEKAITDLENPATELAVYRHLSGASPDTAAAVTLLPNLKNLPKWRHALLWQRAGDGKSAVKLAAEAVAAEKNQVIPLRLRCASCMRTVKRRKQRRPFPPSAQWQLRQI